jgi:hypothetical protein
MYGDNSDVRPPQGEEIWRGGVVGVSGSQSRVDGQLRSVTVALDGVCLEDGEFWGPNRMGMFENLVEEVDVKLEAARIARVEHDRGLSSAKCLDRVEGFLGPADTIPPPPPAPRMRDATWVRSISRQSVRTMVGMIRRLRGDDEALYFLMSWLDSGRPQLRRG